MKFLREHKWDANLSKCDFYKDIIDYLGHIISNKGISVEPEKIEAMMSWPTPTKLTDVRSFVGLAGYCRRLTEGYSASKVESMYRLRKPACEHVVP